MTRESDRIKKLATETSKAIEELMNKFESETGLYIHSIDLNRVDYVGGDTENIVKIDVRMDRP